MQRPILNDQISVDEFKDYYWLKEELVRFCKSIGIATIGGKIEISNRIIRYLHTGEIVKPTAQHRTSHFDWNNATLTLDTIITDNYRNTENVRAFMKKEIGEYFKFTQQLIQWTKCNIGKTLADAITEWKRFDELKKDKNYKTEIMPSCEYNAYIRDFLADNPNRPWKDAVSHWNIKKTQKGSKKYSKEDIE
ncbi:MAG: SAP domain-containing protein [Ignavibacteria bacterium]|jgi:hypothetical protein|nr:SAP domain-containing protein [Ignavibacteria bacterium]